MINQNSIWTCNRKRYKIITLFPSIDNHTEKKNFREMFYLSNEYYLNDHNIFIPNHLGSLQRERERERERESAKTRFFFSIKRLFICLDIWLLDIYMYMFRNSFLQSSNEHLDLRSTLGVKNVWRSYENIRTSKIRAINTTCTLFCRAITFSFSSLSGKSCLHNQSYTNDAVIHQRRPILLINSYPNMELLLRVYGYLKQLVVQQNTN